ncbi:MAG: ATP-binding cassette domain-containing protein [Candidatus Omnitrophica bacterium]|nr:ATP-binding cassette domain-containing protein [Candidatus Omnitrophota bacterium]
MATPIVVNNLTKRYDTAVALAGISFDVQPGEIMGFLGPNGAGKTTTMRILTGMLAPTEGSVCIDGIDVGDDSLAVRRRIGYLPEHISLYPELRVQEYLEYRAHIKGVPRSDRRACLQEAIAQCDIADVSRKLIGRLSRGYRQRVALADCLLARPKILILDEPTVGLDPHQIRQTRELITRLGQQATILLSTHILPEVEMICHRVAIINQGRIVAVDSPAHLRQRLQGARVIRTQLKGEASAVEAALRQLPGVARVQLTGQTDGYAAFDLEVANGGDIREAIFRLAVEQRFGLRELSQAQATLEDVFIQLTTKE